MLPGLFYEVVAVRSNNTYGDYKFHVMQNLWKSECHCKTRFFPFWRRVFSLHIYKADQNNNLHQVWLWKTMKVLILCEPKVCVLLLRSWKHLVAYCLSLKWLFQHRAHRFLNTIRQFWKHDEARHLLMPSSLCEDGEYSALNTLGKLILGEMYGLSFRVHLSFANHIHFRLSYYSPSHSLGEKGDIIPINIIIIGL